MPLRAHPAHQLRFEQSADSGTFRIRDRLSVPLPTRSRNEVGGQIHQGRGAITKPQVPRQSPAARQVAE